MAAPAVIHDFQPESRWAVEVGFESQGFFLFAPAAHKPVHGQGARKQIEGQLGAFKPSGRELETGVKAGTTGPAGFDHFAAASAGNLHPTKCGRASAAVIAREGEIPDAQGEGGTQRV